MRARLARDGIALFVVDGSEVPDLSSKSYHGLATQRYVGDDAKRRFD